MKAYFWLCRGPVCYRSAAVLSFLRINAFYLTAIIAFMTSFSVVLFNYFILAVIVCHPLKTTPFSNSVSELQSKSICHKGCSWCIR